MHFLTFFFFFFSPPAERKLEFRRLCDLLRYHLQTVVKFQNQTSSINLNNAESLTFQLETRFELFNTAAKMDLWQEAFKVGCAFPSSLFLVLWPDGILITAAPFFFLGCC